MSAWPMIDPGKMIHRITLLEQTVGSNISGTITVWVPVRTIWAQIDPVRGIEVIKSGQDTSQLYLTVRIWWMAGVAANMRVALFDTLYLIQTIENPGQRNVVLILNCLALGKNDK